MKQPFFYDITLRDGNQALKKPWQLADKKVIFEKLLELNVQGVEVGFPASSDMDFEACRELSLIAPDNLVVSGLARCVKSDIISAVNSIGGAKKPRVHTFLTLSPFHMKYVLDKSPEEAAKNGIELIYINTGKTDDPVAALRQLSDGKGYDDVFCFAPVVPIVEQADAILGIDGCLNFFAGPAKTDFKAPFNFYNVHYSRTHICGTSGGNTDDMKEAIAMMGEGLDPAGLVTHVGGLNAVIDTTMNLPNIPGGKKLIYTHVTMPLTPITGFEEKGKANPAYAELDRLCKASNGLWNADAERYLLENADKL